MASQVNGITVLAIGHRPDSWVLQAEAEFFGRLNGRWRCSSQLLKPCHAKSSDSDCKKFESEQLHKRTLKGGFVIALEERGKQLDSGAFSKRLADKVELGPVVFWLGGAAGLSRQCVAAADEVWSLSTLTYAHSLARVVLAEQIYRAWSISVGHPYHKD